MTRTTREVIESHLRYRADGELETDLRENFHADVALMSAEGTRHGHDGVRELAKVLESYVPDLDFQVKNLFVVDRFAMLEWTARDGDNERLAHDGVDTFVVEDGRIVAQSIHFSVVETDAPPG